MRYRPFLSIVSVYLISDQFSCLDQSNFLEFPLPNEIVEKVLLYLLTEDLISLAVVSDQRLRDFTYKILRKKANGKYFVVVSQLLIVIFLC